MTNAVTFFLQWVGLRVCGQTLPGDPYNGDNMFANIGQYAGTRWSVRLGAGKLHNLFTIAIVFSGVSTRMVQAAVVTFILTLMHYKGNPGYI